MPRDDPRAARPEATRLRRNRTILMIATIIVLTAGVVGAAAGWASRSVHLILVGLIGGIIALATSVLLGYLDYVSSRQSNTETTGTRTIPPASDAPVEDFAASTTSTDSAAKETPPVAQQHPQVQRKDLARRVPRPLDSHHSAYALEQAGTDRLFVLAGAALGARHDQSGIAREDNLAFTVDPAADGMVIAAVADGLGSARLSHVASALAARHAVALMSAWRAEMDHPGTGHVPSWHQIADWLVERLGALLTEEYVTARADELGMPAGEESRKRLRRPASTLAVVAVDHIAAGIRASWCTVGDCEVAIADTATGGVTWLTPVHEREGQVTPAVPSARFASHWGHHLIADGQAVLAMTDGMARLLLRQREHTLRALATAQVQDSALDDLLVALDLRLQGEFDDRAVVAVGPMRQAGR